MSLINDALKRAKHAQQKSQPPPSATALRPVDATRPSTPVPGFLILLLFVLLASAVGLTFWFVLAGTGVKSSRPQFVSAKSAPAPAIATPKSAPSPITTTPPAGGVPMVVSTRSAERLLPSEEKTHPTKLQNFLPDVTINASAKSATATSTPAVPSAAANQPPSDPAQPSSGTTTQTVATASGPPPAPPLPKLQGIFYRADRPAALLDGRMVLVGKTVGEYRVADIRQQRVTVVRAGQTNVLELPD